MRIFFTLLFALSFLNSLAQVVDSTSKITTADTTHRVVEINAPQNTALLDPNKKEVFRKNIIKINLSSFALYNNSLSYERSLSRKITFVAGYRYMPEVKVTTPLLMGKTIEKYVKEDDGLMDDLNAIAIGNTTLTSEVRFYTGQKPGARGFYLSLYGRYMNLTAAFPHEYETKDGTYTIPFDGTLKGLAGGLMIGSQWLIAKRVAFDWYILGGHYGKLKIDLPAMTNLTTMTPDEKSGLQEDLESINGELMGKAAIKATVTDQGVNVKGSMPFAGIRGLGFSLGYAF